MIRKLLPVSMLCLFLGACSCQPQQATETLPGKAASPAGGVILSPSGTEVIVLDMQNGTASLNIHKKEGQTIYLKFSSGDYKKLTGKLVSSDQWANIRFNQITMPNGEMDGPFSREITYDLAVKGDYLLNISESLMAGDPWEGDFEVTISLSR